MVETHVHTARKDLEDLGDKATDEIKTLVEAECAKFEELAKGDDVEAIRKGLPDFFNALKPLRDLVNPQPEAEAAPGEENVVDAEIVDEKKDEDNK
jgi:molecular chaperone DnaK